MREVDVGRPRPWVGGCLADLPHSCVRSGRMRSLPQSLLQDTRGFARMFGGLGK